MKNEDQELVANAVENATLQVFTVSVLAAFRMFAKSAAFAVIVGLVAYLLAPDLWVVGMLVGYVAASVWHTYAVVVETMNTVLTKVAEKIVEEEKGK